MFRFNIIFLASFIWAILIWPTQSELKADSNNKKKKDLKIVLNSMEANDRFLDLYYENVIIVK